MAEDAAFFISAKPNPSSLRDDYVSVMDMDYFELSLRLCSNRNSNAPRIDLSAASNALHIRTCSDVSEQLCQTDNETRVSDCFWQLICILSFFM